MIRRNGTNKITKVLRTLALGMVITASGLIVEAPAYAEGVKFMGKYWDADTETYVVSAKQYLYENARGTECTTNSLETASKWADGEIRKGIVASKSAEDTTNTFELCTMQSKVNPIEIEITEINEQKSTVISKEEFTEIANEKMLELVNAHRVENGLNQLERDSTLEKIATEKSQHMVSHNYMDHYYNGIKTRDIQSREYQVYTLGENCLANYNYEQTKVGAEAMATSMFNQWKHSTGHDANMLFKDNTKIGFGFAFSNGNAKYASYGTQLFGDEHMNQKFYVDYACSKSGYNSLADLDNM